MTNDFAIVKKAILQALEEYEQPQAILASDLVDLADALDDIKRAVNEANRELAVLRDQLTPPF